MMPTIQEIHEVTAIVGDVAVVATAVGALASAASTACASFGFLRAEVVLDKVATGSVGVGVDITKFLAGFGGLFGKAAKK
jgi:hypothetical protein